ncbi:MAG: hypothetical protein AABX34_01445 [Nanoarchaeota archaeon]
MMNTYIFDTNVYGEILVEQNREEIVHKLKTAKSFFIYGVDVIEKEIDNSPKDIKYKGQFFRTALLSLFEVIVDEIIKVTPITEYLANQYFKKFKELEASGKFYKLIKDKRKKYSETDLKIDFEIIAVASLKEVDIVVSADKRTMLSNLAAETYNIINKINGLRTPKLVDYFEFRRRHLK